MGVVIHHRRTPIRAFVLTWVRRKGVWSIAYRIGLRSTDKGTPPVAVTRSRDALLAWAREAGKGLPVVIEIPGAAGEPDNAA